MAAIWDITAGLLALVLPRIRMLNVAIVIVEESTGVTVAVIVSNGSAGGVVAGCSTLAQHASNRMAKPLTSRWMCGGVSGFAISSRLLIFYNQLA